MDCAMCPAWMSGGMLLGGLIGLLVIVLLVLLILRVARS